MQVPGLVLVEGFPESVLKEALQNAQTTSHTPHVCLIFDDMMTAINKWGSELSVIFKVT